MFTNFWYDQKEQQNKIEERENGKTYLYIAN